MNRFQHLHIKYMVILSLGMNSKLKKSYVNCVWRSKFKFNTHLPFNSTLFCMFTLKFLVLFWPTLYNILLLKQYLTAEVLCPLRRRLIMEHTVCTNYLLLCSNVSNEHTNFIHWQTVYEPGILSSLCFYFLLFFSPFSSSFLILWFVCLLWYVWPWNESLTLFFYSKSLIN